MSVATTKAIVKAMRHRQPCIRFAKPFQNESLHTLAKLLCAIEWCSSSICVTQIQLNDH